MFKYFVLIISSLIILFIILYVFRPSSETKAEHTASSTLNNLQNLKVASLASPTKSMTTHKSSVDDHTDPDEDLDGLPDHVQNYIKTEFQNSLALQAGMTNLAHAWNATLKGNLDRDSAKKIANDISANIACLFSPNVLKKSNKNFEQMHKAITDTRAELLSSSKNTQAYIEFNELINGQYFPDQGENNCTKQVNEAPY